MYQYQPDDCFFDLEIRQNIFVLSQYFPAKKHLIISFIEDPITKQQIIIKDGQAQAKTGTTDGFMQKFNNNPKQFKVVNKPEAFVKLAQHVKDVVRPMAANHVHIDFENILTLNGLWHFLQRYGVAPQWTHGYDHWPMQQINGHLTIPEPIVVADTDTNIYQPDQPNQGLRLGYNNQNYDNVMIAHLIANYLYPIYQDVSHGYQTIYYQKVFSPAVQGGDAHYGKLSAASLIKFNKLMFDSKYMSMALSTESERATNTAYKNSNRFIDVMKLNPKSLSLKRLALQLGLNVMESSTNRDPTAPIKSFAELGDLIAYNVNDVYITQQGFEQESYQARFKQNNSLLNMFPYLVYQQDQTKVHKLAHKQTWQHNEQYIRFDRLTANSTSRKLIENVIAPYDNTKIVDYPVVDLHYPDAQVLAEANADPNQESMVKNPGAKHPQLVAKPVDMLDYIAELLQPQIDGFRQRNMPEKAQLLQENIQKVKAYYHQFIGRNTNDELKDTEYYQKHPDQVKPYWNRSNAKIKSIRIPYVTPDYPTNDHLYHDQHDNSLQSYVILSIGGIHGVELREGPYHQDLVAYQEKINTLNYLRGQLHCQNDQELAQALIKDRHHEFSYHGKAYQYKSFLTSNSTKNKPRLRKFKEPTITDSQGHIRKRYAYTYAEPILHQDFSSYYPTIMARMAMFRNSDGNDVFAEVYRRRLKYKALAKKYKKLMQQPNLTPTNRNDYQAKYESNQALQLCMKLLINSASGGADYTHSSRIRCNNKAISMRIIGQLACWYIGQCLAYVGARIPSTNTDGLYAGNVDAKVNKAIIDHATKQLMMNVEPESIDLFISKDSNNRIEFSNHQIQNARGSQLTSWEGPSTDHKTDHPVIVDYLLVHYLTNNVEAINKPFDRKAAYQLILDFINDDHYTISQKLRYLQMPIVGSPKTYRYPYLYNLETRQITILNLTNRILPQKNSDQTIRESGVQVVNAATVEKLANGRRLRSLTFGDIIADTIDNQARHVILQNISHRDYQKQLIRPYYNPQATVSEEKPRNIIQKKIDGLPKNQPIILINHDTHDIDQRQFQIWMDNLDYDFYIDNLKQALSSWTNLAKL